MKKFNYCENVDDAKKLFVEILNEQGAINLFGNVIHPARLLYCAMPDVFARKFHDFIADLVANNFAPPHAIRWTLWDNTESLRWPNYPDFNLLMRHSEMNAFMH